LPDSSFPSVYIITWYDFPLPGGTTSRINGLISQLTKSGIAAEVVSPIFYGENADFDTSTPFPVRRLNLKSLWLLNLYDVSPIRALAILLFSLFSLLTILGQVLTYGRKSVIVQFEQVFSALPAIFAKILLGVYVIGDDIRLYYKTMKIPFSFIIRAYELWVLKYSDVVTTSFRLDFQIIKHLRRNENTLFVPNGVQVNRNSQENIRNWKSMLFVGSFTSKENVKAIDNILNLADILCEECRELEIFIVGGPLTQVRHLFNRKSVAKGNVKFLGRVSQEFLNSLYQSVDKGLLPFFEDPPHTSQRTKALEYFANGLLVVSSPTGIDGIDGLCDGVHCLVAKTKQEMLCLLQEVLLHPAKFTRVASTGASFITENYAWDKVAKTYVETVTSLGRKREARQ